MAWRIHDSVIRGEIDNRVKGHVRGQLWLEGLSEPVKLELTGNACADLAGCRLTFRNKEKPIPMPTDGTFHPVQKGQIGDLTASRKARVFTVPNAEAFAMMDRGEKPPERIANVLYLERYSDGNGRVVIESTEFELKISEPEWRLSAAEEQQRGQEAEKGWAKFCTQLNDAIEQQRCRQKDPEAEWDEHDYERFLKESDARNEKYRELMEKHGDSDEAEEKIAQEMGWARELTPEEAERRQQWIEEMNAAAQEALEEPEPEPDPATEGRDWIRTADGDIAHPLQHRCFESSMKFWHACDELGLKECEDDDLNASIFEFQTTGVKLAGALGGIARDGGVLDGAFTVARLKRALDHLHKAQAGLEAVAPKKLLPEKLVTETRQELFEIREGILRLMDEYRGR